MEVKKTYQVNASSVPPRDPAEYYTEKRRSSTQLSMQTENIKKGCVEMVVMNCRPLSIFKDSGFLKIVEPILAATNAGFVVNDQTVQMFIELEAEEIKGKIRNDIKGKVLSVKLDTLTRSKRCVLVLNVQYIENAKNNIRSLTSFELDENYNSELLFSKIIHVFNSYGIELVQIHTIVYDMSANLANDDFQSSEIELEAETREDEKKIQETLEETITMLKESFDDQISYLNLFHSTLLSTYFYSAIVDALHGSEIQQIVALVNKIRTPIVINYLNDQNVQYPRCDFKFTPDSNYEIKILSVYNILTVLLKCKDFITTQKDPIYQFHPSYFKKASEIKNALEILLYTIRIFQTQDLTIGDFYGEWLRCKLNVSKLQNDFSAKLNEQFDKYENEFLVITNVSAAIYLDPRYQSTLPIERRQEAKWHVKNIWETFAKMEGNKKQKTVQEEEFEKHLLDISIVKVENNANDFDEFDDYIKNISVDKIENIDNDTNIENIIEEFENYPRLQYKASILQFWEEHKQSKPELHKLSKIILGTPAGQSSIIRCFSTLGYLLTLEESIEETTLENIFIIRLYNQFCL